jgi:hypothetical protein
VETKFGVTESLKIHIGIEANVVEHRYLIIQMQIGNKHRYLIGTTEDRQLVLEELKFQHFNKIGI